MARPGGTKRLGEEYPEDGYQTVEEAKQQKINLVEDLVETMEDETIKIATLDGEIPMRICEETVDLSYVATAEAELLEEATGEPMLEESFLI